jgi:TolA-binding protein
MVGPVRPPDAILLLAAVLPAGEAWIAQVPDPAGAPALVATVWPGEAWAGVAATAPSGKPVHARIVHAAPGEGLTVLIESAGAGAYQLKGGPASDWWPQAGVRLQLRRTADGPWEDGKQLQQLWEASKPLGEALADRIFQGHNPLGPTRQVFLQATGWLRIDKPGTYRLATISQDASLVLVDGRPLVGWTGGHGTEHGGRAQHGKELALTAGVHEVRYINATRGDRLCAVLAWTPPGADKPEPVPASAFVQPLAVPARPAAGGWFTWETLGQVQVAGLCAAELRFTAAAETTWTFDDGTSEKARSLRHLFIGPGLRTVRSGEVERTVQVRPRWDAGDWEGQELEQRLTELARRDPGRLTPADLARHLRFAIALDDQAWFSAWSHAAEKRPDPALLLELAFAVQRRPLRAWNRAEQLFHAVAGEPAASRAALHLAGMLVHVLDRAAEAEPLLAQVQIQGLSGDERRLVALTRGDAALARGRVAEAQMRYTEADDVVRPDDALYAVKRRVRLEAAKDHLAAGQLDEAERVLDAIAWETPRERLAPEVGTLRAKVHLRQGEPVAAISRLRPVLAAAPPDDRRADALWLLVQACREAKRTQDAEAAIATLRKDHPYSEAAARAREAR